MRMSLRQWCAALALAVAGWGAAEVRALEIGDAAPPIELDKWVVGEPVNPAKPDGKSVYIVEFWQIPCPPCEDASRKLNELHDKFGPQGLKIVAVNAESEEVTRERLAKVPNKFPSAIDTKGVVFKPYVDEDDRNERPFAFVVGKDGKILWMGIPSPMNGELDRVVKGALDGTFTLEKAKEIAKLQEELQASLQLRDPDAVIAQLEKLAKADPQNPDWIVNLFNIASRTEKPEKAAAALEQWKKDYPDDANAQIQLAIALVSMPDMTKRDPMGAFKAAQRATELDQANPMVTMSAAQIFMELGRFEDAEKVLKAWKGEGEAEAQVRPIIEQHLGYLAKLKEVRDAK